MHQDSLSAKYCGEGIPLWAADVTNVELPFMKFPFPVYKAFTPDD